MKLHEKNIPCHSRSLQKYKDDERVKGLVFKYLHFMEPMII